MFNRWIVIPVTLGYLRGMAVILAFLVLSFCLSSVMPTIAGESGCQFPEASARICGQSGAPDSVPAVIEHVPPILGGSVFTAWLPVPFLPVVALQFHAEPSTPRAPPFSLA